MVDGYQLGSIVLVEKINFFEGGGNQGIYRGIVNL